MTGHSTKTKNEDSIAVTPGNLHLDVRYKDGDEVTKDINCDSNYMVRIMPKVGDAIRKAYHWVPLDQYMYLVLDSVGGHGTKEAISQYRDDLDKTYKTYTQTNSTEIKRRPAPQYLNPPRFN